jgi:F0F1-type ATP synthase membrane subunit b/b'
MTAILKRFDLVPTDLWMIAFTVIVFILLWQTLGRLVFTPYLKFLAEREAVTVDAKDNISGRVEQLANLERDYQEQINRARVEAMSQTEGCRRRAARRPASCRDRASWCSQRARERCCWR